MVQHFIRIVTLNACTIIRWVLYSRFILSNSPSMRQVPLGMFVLAFLCLMAAYLNDVIAKEDSACYRVPSEWCPTGEVHCRSDDSDSETVQLYCCNITNTIQMENYLRNFSSEKTLTGFHLRNSSLKELPMNFFDRLKDLVSLSITHSKILRMVKGFNEPNSALGCLDISNNVLHEFSNLNMLTKLSGLKMLVVANNTNMTELPYLPPTRNSPFIELDVSGNNELECRFLVNLTEYMFYKRIRIKQINKLGTTCLPPSNYFSNPFYVTMKQIDQVEEIFRNCPSGEHGNCTCEVDSLDELTNNDLAYQAFVNCSGRRLTSLPRILPPFTRRLDLSNNNITSLDGISNVTYSKISVLYADYNNITSLKPLEGTMFLENIQNLSLTNNKIDDIPRHIFSNVFDRNSKGKLVYLAKNILNCDCDTAAVTKPWLLRISDYIPDYKELLTICDGVHMRVIEMNPKDFCPTNHFQYYLKYVIVAEITLFVLLVAKVSYDYYVFKTAGYLPWPASKMPKLPCDWCFET